MAPLLFTTGIVIAFFVSLLFLLSLVIKRNDIADIAWGTGITIVGFVGYLFQNEHTSVSTILLVLVTLWGVRLTLRIFLRNIKKGEDPRYKVWRDTWGKWFYLRSYFQVYLLQGFLMIVIGYPLLHVSVFGTSNSLSILTYIGIAVWTIGFLFETIGDYQLDVFIKSKPPTDVILDTGLWKYTRHPNYFGEVTQWWGVWTIALSVPFGYVAIISPLMITFLILKVSGIPMLEKRFEGNTAFETYKQKTSAFFPAISRK